jgi:hypothetical protein
MFSVDGPVPLGTEWVGDGGLLVMSAPSVIYPDDVTLTLIGPDGPPGTPILTTGPVTSASFIGARDGFAVVALLAGRPTPAAQLVAVDLADPGRLVTLPVPLDESTILVAAGLDR